VTESQAVLHFNLDIFRVDLFIFVSQFLYRHIGYLSNNRNVGYKVKQKCYNSYSTDTIKP